MASREYYWIDVKHEALCKERHIRGANKTIVEQKARSQMASWDEQWERKCEIKNRKIATQNRLKHKESNNIRAKNLTDIAMSNILAIKNLLNHTLNVNVVIDWESLKSNNDFSEQAPSMKQPPHKPTPTHNKYHVGKLPLPYGALQTPREPKIEDSDFVPQVSIWKALLMSEAKRSHMRESAWREAHRSWLEEKDRIDFHNLPLLKRQLEEATTLMNKKFRIDLEAWENKKLAAENIYENLIFSFKGREEAFYANQKAVNADVDAQHDQYLRGDAESIIDYCDMVLANSQYPDNFPREWDFDYIGESKILLVDYCLPNPECIPTVKEVKYLPTKDEMKEIFLTEKDSNDLFDSALYQITLRTLHELFEADIINALDTIVFNGYVRAVEKASGNYITACVISVKASKEEFMAFNLTKIEPKACFRALKGIGSSKLHGITPIPPIARIDKNDRRFIDSHADAITVNESTNLAAMDWEDFEHLIREIFEKEFAVGGGEVKVTQASRDGGVDAVIFDPDPIRGGKIVVQAKRYTNTVGVSAVRDLYGTMMNEGAMKGILVTTSTYGPDAYEFVRGKPLTLLSGANLLHLLAKHGQNARIDIAEAKQIRINI